jgi:hypothetical protein
MRLILALLAAAALSPAALHRIYVDERTDVLNGQSFGSAGPYERITGRAHFLVDPDLPANRIIADIDKAPRNDEGKVEFSADIYILKPRDPAKGNGTALLEIVNRGNKVMLRHFNLAPQSNDPKTSADFGDNLLLEQGFTLVWIGWQFDVPDEPGRMRLYAPRIPGLTGVVRSEFIPAAPASLLPLAEREHIPYSPAGNPGGELTVRDLPEAPRQPIARSQWSYEPGGRAIRVAGGLQPGRIYEFIYTAKDPAVVGLGPAAVRDLVAYLKRDGGPMLLGDQPTFLKRFIGVGTSQSGRFLRTFLYEGFNADEKGLQVFDAVWSHVAGAGRGSFNFRFAQPSRDGQPFGNFFYPTDIFPFTDLEQTDTETGARGGLLVKAIEQKVVPKIFYTNGSYEYWGRAASLIHTQPLAPATRIYFFAGAPHGPGSLPPSTADSKNPSNPYDYSYLMRGLLLALNEWVKNGKEPPPSVYPSPQELMKPPRRVHTGYRVSHETEPPRVGKPFDVQVPAVDKDGNEIAGIKLPELTHPLGVYTGWNLRPEKSGAADQMVAFIGSFFRFPQSEIERRYRTKSNYLALTREAAKSLVAQRLLLERDIPALERRAEALWDMH